VVLANALVQIPISCTTAHESFAFLRATQPIRYPKVIKFELTDKSMAICDISFGVDVFHADEPKRANEVGNQKHDDDQSGDSKREHDKLLGLCSVCSLRVFVVVFDESFHSRNIKECNQFC
jgi:hypothetical protein